MPGQSRAPPSHHPSENQEEHNSKKRQCMAVLRASRLQDAPEVIEERRVLAREAACRYREKNHEALAHKAQDRCDALKVAKHQERAEAIAAHRRRRQQPVLASDEDEEDDQDNDNASDYAETTTTAEATTTHTAEDSAAVLAATGVVTQGSGDTAAPSGAVLSSLSAKGRNACCRRGLSGGAKYCWHSGRLCDVVQHLLCMAGEPPGSAGLRYRLAISIHLFGSRHFYKEIISFAVIALVTSSHINRTCAESSTSTMPSSSSLPYRCSPTFYPDPGQPLHPQPGQKLYLICGVGARCPGVYGSWPSAEPEYKGFSNATCKKFGNYSVLLSAWHARCDRGEHDHPADPALSLAVPGEVPVYVISSRSPSPEGSPLPYRSPAVSPPWRASHRVYPIAALITPVVVLPPRPRRLHPPLFQPMMLSLCPRRGLRRDEEALIIDNTSRACDGPGNGRERPGYITIGLQGLLNNGALPLFADLMCAMHKRFVKLSSAQRATRAFDAVCWKPEAGPEQSCGNPKPPCVRKKLRRMNRRVTDPTTGIAHHTDEDDNSSVGPTESLLSSISETESDESRSPTPVPQFGYSDSPICVVCHDCSLVSRQVAATPENGLPFHREYTVCEHLANVGLTVKQEDPPEAPQLTPVPLPGDVTMEEHPEEYFEGVLMNSSGDPDFEPGVLVDITQPSRSGVLSAEAEVWLHEESLSRRRPLTLLQYRTNIIAMRKLMKSYEIIPNSGYDMLAELCDARAEEAHIAMRGPSTEHDREAEQVIVSRQLGRRARTHELHLRVLDRKRQAVVTRRFITRNNTRLVTIHEELDNPFIRGRDEQLWEDARAEARALSTRLSEAMTSMRWEYEAAVNLCAKSRSEDVIISLLDDTLDRNNCPSAVSYMNRARPSRALAKTDGAVYGGSTGTESTMDTITPEAPLTKPRVLRPRRKRIAHCPSFPTTAIERVDMAPESPPTTQQSRPKAPDPVPPTPPPNEVPRSPQPSDGETEDSDDDDDEFVDAIEWDDEFCAECYSNTERAPILQVDKDHLHEDAHTPHRPQYRGAPDIATYSVVTPHSSVGISDWTRHSHTSLPSDLSDMDL
ncbi:hypothetical protein C8R43DRAFT_960988 [Mycena crocata]|nr:hypothetical protein C8R43DRAFT_960988 [Mycena crocata]